MNTWKVILATMVIFGAGVVTGGLLVKQTSLARPPKNPHNNNQSVNRLFPQTPGLTRIEILRRAQRELNLTPEQHEQVEKVISASQERTRLIFDPITPKIREELQHTKDQFRALLTPEQQTRFDEMMKKQQRPRDPHRNPPKGAEKAGATNTPAAESAP